MVCVYEVNIPICEGVVIKALATFQRWGLISSCLVVDENYSYNISSSEFVEASFRVRIVTILAKRLGF